MPRHCDNDTDMRRARFAKLGGWATAGVFTSALARQLQSLNLLCHVFQLRGKSIRNLGGIVPCLREGISHLEEGVEDWQYRKKDLQLRNERGEDWNNCRSELHECFEL